MAEAVVAAYVQDIETQTARGAEDLVGLAELNEYASGLIVEFAETLGPMFRHHMWSPSGTSGADKMGSPRAT